MSRLGISAAELANLFAAPAVAGRLRLDYVMTHFACADEAEDPRNEQQLEGFKSACSRIGNVRVSAANSAAAFLGPEFCCDLVRAGIALYGGNPFADRANPMEPVATLYARVLQIRRLEQPAAVGYGATYQAPAGSRIATVGVGYADGYPRIVGNSAEAFFAGRHLPVIGRVSMDLTCLDISEFDEDEIRVGDYVEMFGSDVSVDEIARLSGTISYEVLTGLSARLPRIYVE
jgi:alanine racemase